MEQISWKGRGGACHRKGRGREAGKTEHQSLCAQVPRPGHSSSTNQIRWDRQVSDRGPTVTSHLEVLQHCINYHQVIPVTILCWTEKEVLGMQVDQGVSCPNTPLKTNTGEIPSHSQLQVLFKKKENTKSRSS